MGVQRADAAGEAGPDGEGQHAVPERIDAGRAGQRLVVAHGVKRASEPKGRQASIEQRDRGQRGEGEPVVAWQCGDGDHRSAGQAEDGLRDAGDAEGSARDLDPVVRDDPGDERQAERADGEGVLGQPEERHADERRHDGRGQRGREEVGEERPVGARGENRRRIGADAEERGMGEREAADMAHDEVVGQRQRGEERGEDEDVQEVALLARHHHRHQPRCRHDGGREDQRGRPPHLRSRSVGRRGPAAARGAPRS